MKLKPKTTIAEHFGEIDDPRVERTKRHKLIDIITIAICAVICGADTWVDIENYGGAKIEWLKQFLELPNGIPSHDTFARVFARINPEQLQQSFLNWVESISNLMQGEVVAIDGKSLRHSYDTSKRFLQKLKLTLFGGSICPMYTLFGYRVNFNLWKRLRIRVRYRW